MEGLFTGLPPFNMQSVSYVLYTKCVWGGEGGGACEKHTGCVKTASFASTGETISVFNSLNWCHRMAKA